MNGLCQVLVVKLVNIFQRSSSVVLNVRYKIQENFRRTLFCYSKSMYAVKRLKHRLTHIIAELVDEYKF